MQTRYETRHTLTRSLLVHFDLSDSDTSSSPSGKTYEQKDQKRTFKKDNNCNMQKALDLRIKSLLILGSEALRTWEPEFDLQSEPHSPV